MKKVLWFLLVIVLAGASCERTEETYCYDCIITFYWHRGAYDDILTKIDTVEKCNYSERDAQLFEKQRTTGWYVISNCGDFRWEECICERRENQ
jgi:hypothetical protein